MRKFLIACVATATAFAVSAPATAEHYGAGEHTKCSNKQYRAKHKKECRHWGAHHHHGIHLEHGSSER